MHTQIGHYQIVSELGRGGMGVVYKGYEPALSRHVAIKLMSEALAHQPEVVERFLREARAMGQLSDPHIVQIYFIGEHAGQPFFAMEFVEGETLAERLRREGRMEPAEAAGLLLQAAQGLSVAHELGVIHREGNLPHQLSGGEQQRLSLALALAAKPEVIFLDEPTSGVDIDGRDVIRDIILGLSQEGTTVLLASHDMAEAEKVATHAVFFKEGKILASGDIESLASARKRLRFTSTPGLVTAELAVAVKSPVTVISEGLYEVASEATPQLMTRISQWLADSQHPLLGVDMGTENLEETYRRFTRSTE